MIIDAISDLHGFYPTLEGGDLLIVAGDLTARDEVKEYMAFHEWVRKQKYKKLILIAGNHDNKIQEGIFKLDVKRNVTEGWLGFEYLYDSGTEFTYYPLLEPGPDGKEYERKTLKIWGSPWTKTFPGMNPHCKAFTCDTEEELAEKWKLIPEDTDILITHSPSYGVLDEIAIPRNGEDIHQGSESLIKPLVKSNCRLHICGHIHEAYGTFKNAINGITYINASHVNEHYKPVNKPIRIIL